MKKELEVVLYIGIPASGKSTNAKEFISKNPNYVIVSRDNFRYGLMNKGLCEPKVEDMITELVDYTILNSLKHNLNVIVDNTNLKAKHIKHFIDLVHERANVSFRQFDVQVKTCIERDNLRDRKVGESVINRMYKDYVNLVDSFDFQPVKLSRKKERVYLKQENHLEKAIISDLDGTLAINTSGRDFMDEELVELDSLNEPVANIVKSYNGKVIIVTGRTEKCRNETENWLRMNNIKFDLLLMRKENDFRKDSIIKREIFDEHIRGKYFIEYVSEDRDSVVKTWREIGLLCLQVHDGNF